MVQKTGSIINNGENQFVLNKFELTKEIGIVESVEVKTKDGRIFEVKFKTGKYTNIPKIRSFISHIKETDFSKHYNKGEKSIEQRSYKTKDGSITLETMEFKDSVTSLINAIDGYRSIDYTYFDTKIVGDIEKANQAIKDSVKRAEYNKDVKKNLSGDVN